MTRSVVYDSCKGYMQATATVYQNGKILSEFLHILFSEICRVCGVLWKLFKHTWTSRLIAPGGKSLWAAMSALLEDSHLRDIIHQYKHRNGKPLRCTNEGRIRIPTLLDEIDRNFFFLGVKRVFIRLEAEIQCTWSLAGKESRETDPISIR